MLADEQVNFGFNPDLTMLNHASYGFPTRALSARAAAIRQRIELDPNVTLGQELQNQLTDVRVLLADWLGLDRDFVAITTNATEAAAAVTSSLLLQSGQTVVTLDTEYASVHRGWERRCDQVGARLITGVLGLPVRTPEQVLATLDALPVTDVVIVQVSAITSSTAIKLPIPQIAAWAHAHKAVLVVDAAHSPGHQLLSELAGADVIFADLHKWVPVPRAVGFLWANGDLVNQIRPAQTTLASDAATLADRFGWPGTFDPASRLVLPAALDQCDAWARTDAYLMCAALTDLATTALESAGAIPTALWPLQPSRMRAFLLPGVPLDVLREALDAHRVRAWTGTHHDGTTLLRVALHVYNDEGDIARLANLITELPPSKRKETL
jgi:isopenicillin-N epimerase